MSSIGTPLSPSATRIAFLGSGELGKEVVIELQRLGCEVIAIDRFGNLVTNLVTTGDHIVEFARRRLPLRVTYGDVAPVSSRTPLWIAALIAAFVILDAWALALFLKHRRKQRLRGEHPPPLPGAASQSS